jgi:xylulokinase
VYSIGYDIGSSSIKAAIIEIETGRLVASNFFPKEEMKIESPKPGWAEQNPELWWDYVKILTKQILAGSNINGKDIKSIGISYQMHGLVLVDKNKSVIRPSIIWCDSRAVEIGNKAFDKIGSEKCLAHHLNSPGNFTASKLRWVKEYEPENYKKIFKMMLPGDFIAMKLTGTIVSTVSGLSEGIFWDFKEKSISKSILNNYEIDESLIPEIRPTFAEQGRLSKYAADKLGFTEGIVVSYRAGDQPNNAFSLNVLNPGEIAATAGTSGVVYGVIDKVNYDPKSRVNTFIHVNNDDFNDRLGVLLCINGTGILNSWVRKNFTNTLTYDEMNSLAEKVAVGSEGVTIYHLEMDRNVYWKTKILGVRFLVSTLIVIVNHTF